MSGPLQGVRVVEMAGIGPCPFCGMMLADMGAEVIRIDRPQGAGQPPAEHNYNNRGKKSVALDLKSGQGVADALALIATADALIEGFRPGVMERLGLGPDVCLQANPKLVFGRMTGWGQHGPLAQAAGHDLNYIALTGALGAMGRDGEPPAPPLNLIGDYGGGGMLLGLGVLAAVISARHSGQGQVVDAAMTDGTSALMSMIYGLKSQGLWGVGQGRNLLDGAAHFYDCYRCADGKFVSIGSIEPQFYALLREKAGLDEDFWDAQHDRSRWPQMKQRIEEIIATKTRDQWCKLMEGTDVCFAPVLDMDEAPLHPHNQARQTFVQAPGGNWQPAPAPRFSATPSAIQGPVPATGQHNDELLGG